MNTLRSTVLPLLLLLSACVTAGGASTTGPSTSTPGAQALPPASLIQHATSGLVGCAPHEVGIADDRAVFGARSWRAGCRGQAYFCSATGQMTVCTAARGAAQAETQGCGSDSQCKGERVCESGRCVNPAGSGSANQGPATVESAGGTL